MRSPPPALRQFLEPYDPAIARLFFAARRAVLAAAPPATELLYDAYNAVAAAYTFSDRLKDAFCHVAAYRDYVNLGFNRGAALADPAGLLVGTGKSIRHIRIERTTDLEPPAVRRLIAAAVAQGREAGRASAAPARSIVKPTYPTKRRPSPAGRARRRPRS